MVTDETREDSTTPWLRRYVGPRSPGSTRRTGAPVRSTAERSNTTRPALTKYNVSTKTISAPGAHASSRAAG